MRRRDFLKAIGSSMVVSWPLSPRAQPTSDLPVIGVLLPGSLAASARIVDALRSGLQDLGYFEGRNYTLEFRFADGMVERLPAAAGELVQLKPALIVTGSPEAVLALHKVTQTIPIVM